MGDYGFYIWSAYAVAGAAIAFLTLAGIADYRAQRRMLARLERRSEAGHD